MEWGNFIGKMGNAMLANIKKDKNMELGNLHLFQVISMKGIG